jgi:phosphatidylserine/phosphatidylglycerophosphate/cardiolipin synthase-like enzyme
MAKFLTTNRTSLEIETLIDGANEVIIIISPYLQISPIIMGRLEKADNKGIKITIVFREIRNVMGKIDIKRENQIKNSFKKYKNVNLYKNINLHAKCYINESKAIIS